MPPFTYASRANPYVASIGSLLAQRGDIEAQRAQQVANAQSQAAQARGQAWGGAVQSVGQILGGATQQFAQRRQEAEVQKQGQAQDQAFVQLMSRDRPPDPREILQIYGPERGMKIASGLHAFAELHAGDVKDARDTAGRLVLAVESLSPAMQAKFWPDIRQAAVKGGLATDISQIPEQPTPEFLTAVKVWASGKEPVKPEAPKLTDHDPTKDLIDPITGEIKRAGAPKPEEPKAAPNPTEASLAAAAAGGDRTAGKALELLRQRNGPLAPRSPIWVIDKDGNFRDLAGVAPPGSKPASTREQGRPVTSGDANRVADLDTSLNDLNTLTRGIGNTGTLPYLGAHAPNWMTNLTGWGADAKSRQAVIDRVKQVIGKALEGGVLRKEDEYKYEKILPTIGDNDKVATDKLNGLWSAITQRRQTTLDSLSDAGYDITKFSARPPIQRQGGKIRARDENGVLHEAAPGTALPKDWKVEP